MSATNGHTFAVTDALQAFAISKQPSDKVTISADFTRALPSGVTVSSFSAVTITPVDGVNAPTSSLVTLDVTNKVASITVDAGLPAWNVTGKGRIKFTVTYSNGDKREFDLDCTIVQL